MTPEPCMCGATDCPRCYPRRRVFCEYDDDDWQEDQRDEEKDRKRDEDDHKASMAEQSKYDDEYEARK